MKQPIVGWKFSFEFQQAGKRWNEEEEKYFYDTKFWKFMSSLGEEERRFNAEGGQCETEIRVDARL